MRITESLMSNGDTFTLELTSDAPKGDALDPLIRGVRELNGYIAVFDNEVAVPTFAGARFVGRVMRREGRAGFSGWGLASLVQSPNDLGKMDYGGTTRRGQITAYQSWTLSTWITEVLGSSFNGITKGTITTTGLSSFESWWLLGLGALEAINAGCAMAGGAVWKIDTEGELTAGPISTIFPTQTDPDYIIARDFSTSVIGDVSPIRGNITRLVEDSTNKTSQVVAVGAGSGLSVPVDISATQSVAFGFDGADAVIRRLLNSSTTEDALALARAASAALATHAETTREYEIEAIGNPRRFIGPGDGLYVYDPELDVYGDTDILFNGTQIRPLSTVVETIRWETEPSAGVWLYDVDGGDWYDLTRYVRHNSRPSARIVCGNGAGAMDVATIAGPERFYVDKPTPKPLPPGSEVFIGIGDVPGGVDVNPRIVIDQDSTAATSVERPVTTDRRTGDDGGPLVLGIG